MSVFLLRQQAVRAELHTSRNGNCEDTASAGSGALGLPPTARMLAAGNRRNQQALG